MPIAPITGMLKKHLLKNIAISGVGGLASGYGYWYYFVVPKTERRDAWYVAQALRKEEEAANQ